MKNKVITPSKNAARGGPPPLATPLPGGESKGYGPPCLNLQSKKFFEK